MKRIAYLWFKGLISETENASPVVVVDANQVVDLSATPEICGIYPGMKLVHAKKICPNLKVLPFDEKRFKLALEPIIDSILECTPRVEKLSPNELFVGIFQAEQSFLGHLKKYLKPPYRVIAGFGSNKFLAKIAALKVRREVEKGKLLPIKPLLYSSIPSGSESDFLKSLPVDFLWPLPGLIPDLRNLGFHTLGEIASAPEPVLYGLFGHNGKRVQDLSKGIDTDGVSLFVKDEIWEMENEFEPEISDTAPIENFIRYASEILCRKMESTGKTAGYIKIGLKYTDGSLKEQKREYKAGPNPEAINRSASLLLNGIKRTSRVKSVTLSAGDFKASQHSQMTFFDRDLKIDNALSGLLSKYPIRTGSLEESRRERMLRLWDPIRAGYKASPGAS